MSDLTHTCEESLARMINECPQDEYIIITSGKSPLLLDVYRVPLDLSDRFNYMDAEEKSKYSKGGFGAVAFHKDIWTADERRASRYR